MLKILSRYESRWVCCSLVAFGHLRGARLNASSAKVSSVMGCVAFKVNGVLMLNCDALKRMRSSYTPSFVKYTLMSLSSSVTTFLPSRIACTDFGDAALTAFERGEEYINLYNLFAK